MSYLVYCNECGEVFESHETCMIPNMVPYGSREVVESYTAECPYCHSDDLQFNYKGEE